MQRIFHSSPVVVAFALFGFPAVAQESSAKPGGPDVSFALGIFGGGHIFADGTNLGVASAPEASAGARSNGALGLRASLGVGPWLAAEAEVLGMLTTDRTYGRGAGILGYRLNALAFLRQGDVRPFVLLGAGPMQVATTKAEGKAGLVRDVEGEFHVGVGLCYQIVDILALRADVRAVQMPSNFTAPSHSLMHALAREQPYRAHLERVLRPAPVLDPDDYYALLAPRFESIDIWSTEYLQVLRGENPVADWTRATWLGGLLEALPQALRAPFEAEYRRRVLDAYPKSADGRTLFSFKRLFIVATAA